MPGRAPTPDAVTHEHKTVRRQFIDFQIPRNVGEDDEAFILRFAGDAQIELRPHDFRQFISCCLAAGRAAGMEL